MFGKLGRGMKGLGKGRGQGRGMNKGNFGRGLGGLGINRLLLLCQDPTVDKTQLKNEIELALNRIEEIKKELENCLNKISQ